MKNWFKIFLILFLFGILVYANALNNNFQVDDFFLLGHPEMVQTKYIFFQWDPHNIKYFPGYYRPLAHMVYAFCYGAFKLHFWQYHLMNLVLFVFLCSLVFLLIESLTANTNLAFLTAIFFLIHPINGIMINNIVSSVLSFQLIFIFGTILLLCESRKRINDKKLYFLSLLTAFISLFWYDMGVLTPVYLSVVIIIFEKESFKTKILYLLPFYIISFLFLIFKHFFLNGTPFLTNIFSFHMTMGEYLGTLFVLIKWYVSKLILMKGIVMQWAMPIVHKNIFIYSFDLFLLAFLFILLFCIFNKVKIVHFSLVLILISLAPVTLIAFGSRNIGAMIEPHWFILSSLGFFILLAVFCSFILDKSKLIGIILIFIMVFSYAINSRAYNVIWSDEKTYALYWNRQDPEFKRPISILGEIYAKEGNFKEAWKDYKLALDNNYNDPVAWINLGIINFQFAKLNEAESDFKIALLLEPNAVLANNYLGLLYYKQGQLNKAREYIERALAFDPFMLVPRLLLAKICLAHFQYQEAIKLCLQNLNIKNDDTNSFNLLIHIYILLNNLDAFKDYAYHIIKQENEPAVLTKWGKIMANNNILDMAMISYKKVLQISPNYKDAIDAINELSNGGRYRS